MDKTEKSRNCRFAVRLRREGVRSTDLVARPDLQPPQGDRPRTSSQNASASPNSIVSVSFRARIVGDQNPRREWARRHLHSMTAVRIDPCPTQCQDKSRRLRDRVLEPVLCPTQARMHYFGKMRFRENAKENARAQAGGRRRHGSPDPDAATKTLRCSVSR